MEFTGLETNVNGCLSFGQVIACQFQFALVQFIEDNFPKPFPKGKEARRKKCTFGVDNIVICEVFGNKRLNSGQVHKTMFLP